MFNNDARKWPLGVSLLVAFFVFGAAMCALTIFLLCVPGTAADVVWRLKPEARTDFAQLGGWSVLVMLLAGGGCTAAAIGLARGAEWGRRAAIAVLVVNLLGDLATALARHDWRTLIGLPIAAALIVYLLKLKPH
ncbi:MAG: hypothetical protein M3032_12675 [Verrucomicrobiota bacterium]|nr:hypothetical protein [Verrucomicrobiota bacterium]